MTLIRQKLAWDKVSKTKVVVPTVWHRDRWIDLTRDKLDALIEYKGAILSGMIEQGNKSGVHPIGYKKKQGE